MCLGIHPGSDTALQLGALKAAGCDRALVEKAPGAQRDRQHVGRGGGRLVLRLFGAMAQFERSIIRGRTKAGLDAARAAGLVAGPLPFWPRASRPQRRC